MKTDYRNTPMLDIIFENRNKEYGAYVLRQDYDTNMKRAVGITISSILLIFGSVFIVNVLKAEPAPSKIETVVNVTDLGRIKKPPVEIKEEKIEERKPKGENTVRDTERRVVADEQASEDSVPDRHELAMADAGLTTNLNNTPGPGIEGGTGTELNLEPVFTVAKPVDKPIDFAEIMPKFPGGDNALLAFLNRNTKYPDREKEMDIEGQVIVKFVVNEDGRVSSPVIIRSDSPGFSKEAIRVVGELPRFEPGMQQGKAVKVNFSLPFKWRLNSY